MIKIEFKRLTEKPPVDPSIPVKVVEMGHITEVQYMSRRNHKQTIKMLDGCEAYIVLSTGEVKEIQRHGLTRIDNRKALYKTLAKLRAVINTNVTDVQNVRWCTLTYAENMTDTKRLYTDFEKFNKRFRYWCKGMGYACPEYIVVMEPQGRGAWHAHLLYIWDATAPYIPNTTFAKLWGHGFVRIKKLDDVDNVGAYLTAYLGDMELTAETLPEWERMTQGGVTVKEIETVEDGKLMKKRILKGARLNMYPAKFNMFRCSRGIKKPTVEMMSQEEAEKKVLGATKTFESIVKLNDPESDFESIIIKAQYNSLRK